MADGRPAHPDAAGRRRPDGVVPLGLIAVYVVMQREPPLRTLRFANMEILQRVAPTQAKRWRQPAVLLIASPVAVAIALAGPTDDVRVPRDRAIAMLVVDVSQSMRANDVRPSRLVAAQEAAKQFADELSPGISLGFVAYAGTASMLVAPTTDRAVTKAAIDGLQLADRTATGERIGQISGSSAHTASGLQQPKDAFTTLQQHIGYESIKGDASAGWLRLGALALVLAAVAGMRMHTRLPD